MYPSNSKEISPVEKGKKKKATTHSPNTTKLKVPDEEETSPIPVEKAKKKGI